jgi:hypothetical protein
VNHQHGGHDVVLWAAAAVIAAGPFIAIGLDRWHGWIFLGERHGGTVAAERLARLGLTVLALGAAAATVAGRSGAEPTPPATVVAGWLVAASLLAWAMGLAASRRPWLPWLGAGLGAMVVVASVASGDGLATGLAVAVAAGAAWLLAARERLATSPVSARSASLFLLVLGAGVVVLVAASAVTRL